MRTAHRREKQCAPGPLSRACSGVSRARPRVPALATIGVPPHALRGSPCDHISARRGVAKGAVRDARARRRRRHVDASLSVRRTPLCARGSPCAAFGAGAPQDGEGEPAVQAATRALEA
ncbi:hypothetical protein PsYK624_056500 [Phanerochaete sordida]|uniref:Uncharacterized protein n=1 Tax=Phanerochaete sordida TaxID=48140 RepID=A0A9P3LD52_9APHY|nr:hypothetical protein PsYK624_056500 [Phanerochaete sordida]